eukprot:g45986.t1
MAQFSDAQLLGLMHNYLEEEGYGDVAKLLREEAQKQGRRIEYPAKDADSLVSIDHLDVHYKQEPLDLKPNFNLLNGTANFGIRHLALYASLAFDMSTASCL